MNSYLKHFQITLGCKLDWCSCAIVQRYIFHMLQIVAVFDIYVMCWWSSCFDMANTLYPLRVKYQIVIYVMFCPSSSKLSAVSDTDRSSYLVAAEDKCLVVVVFWCSREGNRTRQCNTGTSQSNHFLCILLLCSLFCSLACGWEIRSRGTGNDLYTEAGARPGAEWAKSGQKMRAGWVGGWAERLDCGFWVSQLLSHTIPSTVTGKQLFRLFWHAGFMNQSFNSCGQRGRFTRGQRPWLPSTRDAFIKKIIFTFIKINYIVIYVNTPG